MTPVVQCVKLMLPTKRVAGSRPACFSRSTHNLARALNTSRFLRDSGARGASQPGRVQRHLPSVCDHSRQGKPEARNQEGPNISAVGPALQQWGCAANAHLGDISIKPKSAWKIQWICNQCPSGHLHRWSAPVYSRSTGSGCPQCAGKTVCKHNSLATKAPEVAAQWDYTANITTPDNVIAKSNKSCWWLCDHCGHHWKARLSNRVTQGRGCPHCADVGKTKTRIMHPTFAGCQHPLLAEWDYKRNALRGYRPDKIKLKRDVKIFWLCTKCPAGQQHSWSAQPFSRTSRSKPGCLLFAGQAACQCNSLQALYPDIAAEWDYTKNSSQPSDHSGGSHTLAWWSSPRRGSWQQAISSRTARVRPGSARLKHIQHRQDCEG